MTISPRGRHHVTRHRRRAGFSLVELLMAIVILSVGVIAIASLFPAGIAQQRRTVDDTLGPTIARNALALLRSRVDPDMFGTFETFGRNETGMPIMTPNYAERATVGGDWPWMRPAMLIEDDPATPVDERGAIDIFSGVMLSNLTQVIAPTLTEYPDGYVNFAGDQPGGPRLRLYGIPFNPNRVDPVFDAVAAQQGWSSDEYALNYRTLPPSILITQRERTYPLMTEVTDPAPTIEPPLPPREPQFHWDCMFRRFQGRVLVAIFVYRVHLPPGRTGEIRGPFYFDDPTDASHPDNGAPVQVPFRLAFGDDPSAGGYDVAADPSWDTPTSPYSPFEMDPEVDSPNIIFGTEANQEYSQYDPEQSWQEPRQWILDQNNVTYTVVSRYREDRTVPMEVELSRPVSPVPGREYVTDYLQDPVGPWITDSPYHYRGDPVDPTDNGLPGFAHDNIVTDIWYVPRYMDVDTDGDGDPDAKASITPTYLLVAEL